MMKKAAIGFGVLTVLVMLGATRGIDLGVTQTIQAIIPRSWDTALSVLSLAGSGRGGVGTEKKLEVCGCGAGDIRGGNERGAGREDSVGPPQSAGTVFPIPTAVCAAQFRSADGQFVPVGAQFPDGVFGGFGVAVG